MSPVKIRSWEAGGMQTTRLSSYYPTCPPAPQIWDPAVVPTASRWWKGRVLKYLVGTLGPERKLCVPVCGRQGLLREQGERAGLLMSVVQGKGKLLSCEVLSIAQQLLIELLFYREDNKHEAQLPQHSEVLSNVEEDIHLSTGTSFCLPNSPWTAIQVTSVHQDSDECSEIQQSSVENFLILCCF